MKTKAKKCKVVEVVIDVEAVVTPDSRRMYMRRDESMDDYFDRMAEEYQRWADDFMEFIRDHRHQDINNIDIRRVTEEQCSECHQRFELDTEFNSCAYCGLEVEK